MHQTLGERIFYSPTQKIYGDPAEFDLDYEDVYFDSDGFKLHGWFFRASGEPRGTIVHCHGNGGNITGHYKYTEWLSPHGWNVLCFDYRGYGRSEGVPTRAGTVTDAHRAIDYAINRPDVDESAVAMLGQSLGAAVGIVVAAQRTDLQAVIIEGAFASYQTAANFVCRQNWLLWGVAPIISKALIAQGLDPIDHVADIAPTPLLLVAGTNDHICDYRQTLQLYEKANDPKSKWIIEGGSHTAALSETKGEGQWRFHEFFEKNIAT